MTSTWMIYGANGYTGRLCVEEALRRGERPIIAGRNADAISKMAEKTGLPSRVFSLDEGAGEQKIANELRDVHTLLLCAGPFSRTSRPALDACLASGTHYVDVTGEIAVFESCIRKHADALKAGIAVLPGAGFDVVPSDCLAKFLSEQMPDATHLTLAFASSGKGSMSRGTATTMIENLGSGSAVREDGKIVAIGSGARHKPIRFRDRVREAIAIPWGDISTAFHSTNIENIEVYMAMPKNAQRFMRVADFLGPVLQTKLAQQALKSYVDKKVSGPDESARKESKTQLWGQVSNESDTIEATLIVPEGYTLTALAAVDISLRIAANEVGPGFHTPSLAFGSDYILSFPETDLEIA